jgi:ribosomal protein L40E
MPPAPVERWPAKRRPSEPAPVASPSAEAPAPWPPIGASWPPQNAAAASWPEPDPALVSASVAAAHQAEQAESQLIATIWAESAQEVLNRGNVRVCHRCALPVSTHARFCRRCGTQQT